MDLGGYYQALRANWRLIVATTLLATLLAALYVAIAPRKYAAETELFVSLAENGGTAGTTAYQGSLFGQERAQSYAQIVNKRRVTGQVVNRLGLEESADDLGARISASVPDKTVLIDVTVTDGKPAKARLIANTVASVFIDVVDQIETPPGASTSPVKVSVVEDAALPTSPVSPRTKVDIALGLILGALLGAALALLRATLDTRVRTAEDVKAALDLPVLGIIPQDREAPRAPLVSQLDTHAPRVEAFRQLRTNLRFLGVDQKIYSLVITSPWPVEGKSLTTCNLAITLGEAGLDVAIVDADLRRPTVAEYFGIEGAVGLSSVLSGQAALEDALQVWGEGRVRILPSGPVPPNPTEMLESHRMASLLASLTTMVDVVLIDAPPVLPVADATVLGALADGVVLVARAGKTRRENVVRAVESLRRVDARIVGAVLNGSRETGPSSYGYGYSPDPSRSGSRSAPGAGPAIAVSRPAARPFAASPLATEPPPAGGPTGSEESATGASR